MMSISSARSAISPGGTSPRPYVNKVGILPSSIPAYHKDYMEREKDGVNHDLSPPLAINDEVPGTRTEAEKEEAARRLNPHARSTVRLDESSKRPQGMTPINTAAKKSKPVRWQFGIRSRNAPWEALLCIHKALYKLGASHLRDEGYNELHGIRNEDPANDTESSASGAPLERESRDGAADPTKLYKLPADPWHIQVRWPSTGMSTSISSFLCQAVSNICWPNDP